MASVRTKLNRTDEVEAMPNGYRSWIGQPVVLEVASGDLRLPLRGVIIDESASAIHFRVGKDWDFNIQKLAILALEQDWTVSAVN
ncbi:MAG: hypothetical protein ABSA96_06040 [Candidatus Acidiferrales bacterium]|jgi:hypothetical protein